MNDLPTKDAIVERVAEEGHRALLRDIDPPRAYPKSQRHIARKHLDALTVPDLLRLLELKGGLITPLLAGLVTVTVLLPEEKPDAVS